MNGRGHKAPNVSVLIINVYTRFKPFLFPFNLPGVQTVYKHFLLILNGYIIHTISGVFTLEYWKLPYLVQFSKFMFDFCTPTGAFETKKRKPKNVGQGTRKSSKESQPI